jgi:hypothetical protein
VSVVQATIASNVHSSTRDRDSDIANSASPKTPGLWQRLPTHRVIERIHMPIQRGT